MLLTATKIQRPSNINVNIKRSAIQRFDCAATRAWARGWARASIAGSCTEQGND